MSIEKPAFVSADRSLEQTDSKGGCSTSPKILAPLRSPIGLHIVILLILPAILVATNYSIIFSKPIGIDPFLYSGFHLHFPEFLRSRFHDTYYATRIPWLVLGYVSHRLLNDEYALYAEHIIVFYLAVFSLYSAISSVFADRLAAFAATVLLATNSWFLLAAGWDYVDGLYIGCELLSVAMFATITFGNRWRIAAIGWGAALALAITLYILLAILIPIEVVMFLFLNRLGRHRNIYLVAGFALIGAIGAFVCMGCISWLAGGKLFYLLPQITILRAVAANRFRYDLPLSQWAWKAEWLLAPAAIWTFSAVWAAQYMQPGLRKFISGVSETDVRSRLWVASLFCVAGFALFVALEFDHFYVLQSDDKSRALLPFEWIVLGGILALVGRDLRERQRLSCALMVTAVALAPWVASAFNLIAPWPPYFTGPLASVLWISAGALVLWVPVRKGLWKFLLVTLYFSVVGFGAADTDWMAFPADPIYKQARLAIFEASRAIGPYNPTTAARFWFDVKDPLSPQLRDIVSTYLYEYSLINENFPSLTDDNGRASSIAPGDRIIILTSGRDPLPAADRAVADEHLIFREVATKQIRRPGIAFSFVVADAVPTANAISCSSPADTVSTETIPLASLQPQNGGSILAQDGTMVLTTSPHQWAYAATAPIPLVGGASGFGVVCLRLQVQEGKLGVGVYARGNDAQMLAERPVETTGGPTEVELTLPEIAHAGSIVLRSWSPSGDIVRAQISLIKLLRPRLIKRAVSGH